MASCISAALVLLSCAAAVGNAQSSPPSWVGRFTDFTSALPNNQLPHVPLLGNGQLGLLLDAHKGTNALSAWLGSASMWSCGKCNTLAKGCCRAVSIGGLRLSFPTSVSVKSYAAEQRIGAPPSLFAAFTTSQNSVLSAEFFMHPTASIVVANVSWTAAGSDPSPLPLNVSLWVEAPSKNGAAPSPANAGCMSREAQPQSCYAPAPSAESQLIYVGRHAAAAATPMLVWASLSAAIIGGGVIEPPSFSSITTPGGTFSATVTLSLPSGTAPLSLVVAENESRSPDVSDPAPAGGAVAMSVASAGVDSLISASRDWWTAFWSRSSVSLPGQPGVEELWYGAQYVLAATSSTDASVPGPGLYGVWVSFPCLLLRYLHC